MKFSAVTRLVLAVTLFVVVAEAFLYDETRPVPQPDPGNPSCSSAFRTKYQHISEDSTEKSHQKRQAKSYRETRTKFQIYAEHAELVAAGYYFIGWHGTSYNAGVQLLGGAPFLAAERQGNARVWMGIWTSNSVERSFGYLAEHSDPILLRVYLRIPDDMDLNVFLDPSDINNALLTPSFCNHESPSAAQMLNGEGNYLISGPDGAFDGQELVMSRALNPHVRYLASAHNTEITSRRGMVEYNADPNSIETTEVTWNMDSQPDFLESVLMSDPFLIDLSGFIQDELKRNI